MDMDNRLEKHRLYIVHVYSTSMCYHRYRQGTQIVCPWNSITYAYVSPLPKIALLTCSITTCISLLMPPRQEVFASRGLWYRWDALFLSLALTRSRSVMLPPSNLFLANHYKPFLQKCFFSLGIQTLSQHFYRQYSYDIVNHNKKVHRLG